MENQEVQESPDKVQKQFQGTIKKIVAILGTPAPLSTKRGKVSHSELDVIVAELLKEEKEKNAKEVSAALKALLTGHQSLQIEIAKKRKELEKLEQEKMKEFNKEAANLFSRIEALDEKEKSYYTSLVAATTATQPE